MAGVVAGVVVGVVVGVVGGGCVRQGDEQEDGQAGGVGTSSLAARQPPSHGWQHRQHQRRTCVGLSRRRLLLAERASRPTERATICVSLFFTADT